MIMPRRSPPSYGVEGPMVAKHVTLFDLPPDDRQSSRSTQPGGKIPVATSPPSSAGPTAGTALDRPTRHTLRM
ncbi:hypothetical protein ABBQ38_001640 [Trebouxia sp. C0009 RCD-2024]